MEWRRFVTYLWNDPRTTASMGYIPVVWDFWYTSQWHICQRCRVPVICLKKPWLWIHKQNFRLNLNAWFRILLIWEKFAGDQVSQNKIKTSFILSLVWTVNPIVSCISGIFLQSIWTIRYYISVTFDLYVISCNLVIFVSLNLFRLK